MHTALERQANSNLAISIYLSIYLFMESFQTSTQLSFCTITMAGATIITTTSPTNTTLSLLLLLVTHIYNKLFPQSQWFEVKTSLALLSYYHNAKNIMWWFLLSKTHFKSQSIVRKQSRSVRPLRWGDRIWTPFATCWQSANINISTYVDCAVHSHCYVRSDKHFELREWV